MKALTGLASLGLALGMAGAGMIAPDMATMLSFVFTDAAISAAKSATPWAYILVRPVEA